MGPGARSRSDLWLGLALLALTLVLCWRLVAGVAGADPDHQSFLLVARAGRLVLVASFAWLFLTDRHDLAAMGVAAPSVLVVIVTLAVGLLVQPELFVAPERPKAPDDVDEARILGLLVTGVMALGAGAVLRRWWRSRQALAEPGSD